MSIVGSDFSELYDSALIRRRYRMLASSEKPALAIFKLLETKGPLKVREVILLSGYKKTRIYDALKLLRSLGIIKMHKGLCYISS
jgi:predicted transcriptional regulator